MSSLSAEMPIGLQTRPGSNSSEIIAGDPRLFAWHFVAIVEVSLNEYARQQFTHPQSMANHLTALFFNGARQQATLNNYFLDTDTGEHG